MNAKVGLENLKVYGILTDLGIFHFFAFEPKSKMFYRDPKIVVARGREDFLIGMMHGVFCVLHGFCCADSISFSD
jgi:hypothetical protein